MYRVLRPLDLLGARRSSGEVINDETAHRIPAYNLARLIEGRYLEPAFEGGDKLAHLQAQVDELRERIGKAEETAARANRRAGVALDKVKE